MVNRNCRLLATWESVAKHLIDGALQHAEQCPQKSYLRWMEIARLRKLLRQREAEIDFLKKAAAYFAKMP